MILRALLAALLAVASIASAWAQCRVGASFEHAMSRAGEHAGMMDHHHGKGDCGEPVPRACDAMVQAGTPHAPAVSPPTISVVVAFTPVATAALPRAPLAQLRRLDRPPDRAARFKDIYAKTGRLLV